MDNSEKKVSKVHGKKKLSNVLSPVKVLDKGPMKFYFKTIDEGNGKVHGSKLSSNSFDLSTNPQKGPKSSSVTSKRAQSQVKSTKNSSSQAPVLYSYDSKPNLRPHTNKTSSKSTHSTDTKRKSASVKKERHVQAPQKSRVVSRNAPNIYMDLSTSSVVDTAVDKLRKSSSKDKSFQNKSTMRPPPNYTLNSSIPVNTDFTRMTTDFLDCCDILRDRGQANANMALQLKERFNLMMTKFGKNLLSEEQQRQQELQQSEIQTLKAKNHENELKLQTAEQENKKLWGFFSKIKLFGSYEGLVQGHDQQKSENEMAKEKFERKSSSGIESSIDIDRLMDLFEKQHQLIKVLKRKEAKYIKLLFAIKQQGINIEEIYQNKVKADKSQKTIASRSNTTKKVQKIPEMDQHYESDMQPTLQKHHDTLASHVNPAHDSQIYYEDYSEDSNEEAEQHNDNDNLSVIHHNFVDSGKQKSDECNSQNASQQQQQQGSQDYDDDVQNGEDNDSDFVLYSYRDMQEFGGPNGANNNFSHNQFENLKGRQKLDSSDKFKLNMGAVLQQQKRTEKEDPVGFHQEFMAKIDDFSLSWRQAAMNERKF